MPENQSQLGDLLALLAQLKQGRLASAFVQEISDVSHGAAVVFGNVLMVRILTVGGGQGSNRGVRAGEAVIVLLLGGRSGGSGGSLLSMLMVSGLLVHPRRIRLGIVLMMPVNVRCRHHLGRKKRKACVTSRGGELREWFGTTREERWC